MLSGTAASLSACFALFSSSALAPCGEGYGEKTDRPAGEVVENTDGAACAGRSGSAKIVDVNACPCDWVDLGLSVKWAACNVGAYTPYEDGDYFAWGETAAKSVFSWNTYKHCGGAENTLTKYSNDKSYGAGGFTDNKCVLAPEDDAASAIWGAGCRMPTVEELAEPCAKCRWTWDTAHCGYLVTGPNGNSIFLPASGWGFMDIVYGHRSYGYYWSASLDTGEANLAKGLVFFKGNHTIGDGGTYRFLGHSVRPVAD